jgi:hypothetical protein
VVNKCKNMARAIKNQPSITKQFVNNVQQYVPTREVADRYVQGYLRTFEYIYRVLHVPTFLREYEQYWDTSLKPTAPFVVKLLLVMALGSIFEYDHDIACSHRSIVFQWIELAQMWLSLPLGKSRLNMKGLQIYCLLIIARQACAFDADSVFIPAGALLRTAVHMGYHRDPSHFPNMPFYQAEMRRRLWATVLELCLQSSVDAGAPPLLSLDDFDTLPPSGIDDDLFDECNQFAPSEQPSHISARSAVQDILIRHIVLRLRIANLITSPQCDPTHDEILNIDKEMTMALRENTKRLQSSPSGDKQIDSFRKKMLDLMTYRFLHTLHFAFAIRAKTEPKYYYSRKVCLECSVYLFDNVVIDENDEHQEDFAKLLLIGSGIYRDVLLPALMISFNELVAILENASIFPQTSVTTTLPVVEQYKSILSKFTTFTWLRLLRGETNIKGYGLCAGLATQLEAMEKGEEHPESLMLGRAIPALEKCYDILRQRAEAANVPYVENDESQSLFGWEEMDFEEFAWGEMVDFSMM